MVDSTLIASVKKGENAAFKAMYQQCIGYVYSIVRRYMANESEHPDIIQEIFARIFLSVGAFDETKGEFKFWLRKVVINQCLQHYRQGKSHRLFLPLDGVPEIENGEALPMGQLSKPDIEYLLRQMPEGYRQVFMLAVIDEYDHKEIGELLGISPETSRSQLSRAKSWLRKHLLNNKQKILDSGF
ncbi:MAG: sigma-70 family RNA polymerase sigma factor [Lewinellaceae bacterium]|nr:sigma-70 family RNA polymerase sigma factor [Lewinellaceae bacterium]